ncbi:hypothetical protein N0V88_001488 [Collariella sp. IMI 366227]|nr:hypothetical protein N0V88_001488 [Collariella sp. IMI 366227]
MADTDLDLIARIYPIGEKDIAEKFQYATRTVTGNQRCRFSPPKGSPQPELRRDAREATEPPDSQETRKKGTDLGSLPYLELRFSDGPRAPSTGFVFGTDSDRSDVVLRPNISRLSRRHFALTYKMLADGFYRLVVRDLGSLGGTRVTYDKQGDEVRRNFDWIIAGYDFPENAKTINIQLPDGIKFQIVVVPHDITSPAYANKVKRFLDGAAGSDVLFGSLQLQSGPHTEASTAAQTPSRQPILINRGEIARGQFGVVSRRWDVSTGVEYACKKPIDKNYKREDWTREIAIMSDAKHAHIVQLCGSSTSPHRLFMEYMIHGNLQDEHNQRNFSFDECAEILRQSLSALVYLHGPPKPTAHRDLKPENILVQSRYPLHIKLGDFGFAKAGNLKTHCGTATYAAPEVQPDSSSRSHTVAMDIWSLAVVIYHFQYRLPAPGSGEKMRWCLKIAEAQRRQRRQHYQQKNHQIPSRAPLGPRFGSDFTADFDGTK